MNTSINIGIDAGEGNNQQTYFPVKMPEFFLIQQLSIAHHIKTTGMISNSGDKLHEAGVRGWFSISRYYRSEYIIRINTRQRFIKSVSRH
jgi:hypothetical protein